MHAPDKSLAIRFPLRLERAQLVKEQVRNAYVKLIELMAQTPRGSWHVSPQFGIRDRLEELQTVVAREQETEQQRSQRCLALVAEVNASLLELGLDRYCVDRLELHLPSPDTQGRARAQWASHLFDDFSSMFVLRPTMSLTSGDQEL